jgi:protein-disulfide reductase (glutathione)
MNRTWLLALLLPLLSAACKDPALNVDGERVAPRTSEGGATRPGAVAKVTPTPTPTAAAKPKANAIEWSDSLAWKPWDEASKQAKASNKPMFLLVYADWCPHCRTLKTVFTDPEIAKLSEKFVMVRQDADSDSPWLAERVGNLGGYVPRIYFLAPDGTVRPEITSGNGKYPYFYTPEGIDALKASMKRAAGGA